MEPSSEFAQAVLWELRLIHWLLIALVLLVGFMVLMIFGTFRGMARSIDQMKTDHDSKEFQKQLEDLLTRGAGKEALFAATEALASRPHDPYVHWYLGRANFSLRKYVEAKSSFAKVSEIAPDWEISVEPWLARVEQEIRNSGPKAVQ